MLKASLAAVAGVAIGAAVTAVVYRASKPATDAPSSTKKAARAVERYEAALLTLELPECPSAVRRNRALIAAAVPRVTGCIYIAFEGGMDGSEDELDKNPGGGAGKQRVRACWSVSGVDYPAGQGGVGTAVQSTVVVVPKM